MIRERHEKPLSLLKWGLCRTGELSKATRGISYLLGSSWVTAGLRVPMATTSSSSKVTDFHSTAREASRVPPMWSQLCWLRNEQGTGQEGEGERERQKIIKTKQHKQEEMYCTFRSTSEILIIHSSKYGQTGFHAYGPAHSWSTLQCEYWAYTLNISPRKSRESERER